MITNFNAALENSVKVTADMLLNAAKAGKLSVHGHDGRGGLLVTGKNGHTGPWNSLESDTDTLNLAQAVGMEVTLVPNSCAAVARVWTHQGDQRMAVRIQWAPWEDGGQRWRFAITRLAADIGAMLP